MVISAITVQLWDEMWAVGVRMPRELAERGRRPRCRGRSVPTGGLGQVPWRDLGSQTRVGVEDVITKTFSVWPFLHYLVCFVSSRRVLGAKTLTSGLAIALLVCREERVNKNTQTPGRHPLNMTDARGPSGCERHPQSCCVVSSAL